VSGKLQGKAAVVTGGSRGIGAAIAKRLAAEGARLVFTYVGNKAAAEATVMTIKRMGGQAVSIQADADNFDSVRTAINRAAAILKGIDILGHNAGVIELASVQDSTTKSFSKQFAVNVEAVFTGTLAALPHLRDDGRIIIIGSVNAHTMPWSGGAIYGATKAAVTGLARSGYSAHFGECRSTRAYRYGFESGR
jgi:3-oxoacyl-[acyl-carrier protein] reductase